MSLGRVASGGPVKGLDRPAEAGQGGAVPEPTVPTSFSTTLPGGLVLRTAEPLDLDRIGALLTDRGDEHDAVDHRLVVTDPDLGWESCVVVVDGDEVVATGTLLDEQVRLGQVVLPAGQVELVAVAQSHEHRGLARAVMTELHARSARRGHVLQLMIGIPYFYRRFGYEYAVDIAPARELVGAVTDVDRGTGDGGGTLRDAVEADLAALVALQDAAQSGVDLAVPHPPARLRALLAHTASRTVVLERGGVVVASARVRDDEEDGLLVAEAAAVDVAAARALLAGLVARAAGRELAVVHRAGTVTGEAWDGLLGPADEAAEQYYVRVPDPARLLDALRPVLEERLAADGAVLDLGTGPGGRPRDALVLSTFGAHLRLPVMDGRLGATETGGPMQAPGAVGGLGVAPDQLGALLLGSRGFAGLRRIRPDVYGDPELGERLFPPLTSDVLSYYLPW